MLSSILLIATLVTVPFSCPGEKKKRQVSVKQLSRISENYIFLMQMKLKTTRLYQYSCVITAFKSSFNC